MLLISLMIFLIWILLLETISFIDADIVFRTAGCHVWGSCVQPYKPRALNVIAYSNIFDRAASISWGIIACLVVSRLQER